MREIWQILGENMSFKEKSKTKSLEKIKMLFWQVFAGSRGCINRVKIVSQLRETPLNTNQLSNQLGLNYKVVERHLDILDNNGLVIKVGHRYGATYLLSTLLETNLNLFEEIAHKAKNCKENLKIN